jgi:hypothetical protein
MHVAKNIYTLSKVLFLRRYQGRVFGTEVKDLQELKLENGSQSTIHPSPNSYKSSEKISSRGRLPTFYPRPIFSLSEVRLLKKDT